MDTQENNGALTDEEELTPQESNEAPEEELTPQEAADRKSNGEIAELVNAFCTKAETYGIAYAAETEDDTTVTMVEISEEELASLRSAANRCAMVEALLQQYHGYGLSIKDSELAAMSNMELAARAAKPCRYSCSTLGIADGTMFHGRLQAETARRLGALAAAQLHEDAGLAALREYRKEHQNEPVAAARPFRPE